jgi:2-polyprenyl-3-methyl-5-hydroxy-6-metoxy-1,4-benzoquinol methylase
MSYTIDERNPERQQLLAEILNPPTRDMLSGLPKIAGAKVLDLGCGQGNTTRCLAEALEPSLCIGLEYDADLVDYAQTRPQNPPSVQFQQGDATQLPFPDASFDIVFCRYLLIHMAATPSPTKATSPSRATVTLRAPRWLPSTLFGRGCSRIHQRAAGSFITSERPEQAR